jgi:hypothetical protein
VHAVVAANPGLPFMGLLPYIADTIMSAAVGVRAMVNAGYGCHLNAARYDRTVALAFRETIINQTFWGASGFVEFNEVRQVPGCIQRGA